MTVVVTGASGHIGANLVRELLRRGRTVRVMVHRDTRALEGLDVERVTADLLDFDTLLQAFSGADLVFHLAARISIAGDDGGLVTRTNVEGTRNVVSACRQCGVRRLVHFSSIHALQQKPLSQPIDEARPRVGQGAYAYDRSKARAEKEALAGNGRELKVVVVNPTGIIGRCDFKVSDMGQVFLDLYHRRLQGLVNGGFTWVDVRDVASSVIRAAEVGRPGESYLLGGNWMSIRGLARIVEKVTGVRAPLFTAPMWVARMGAPLVLLAARLTGTRPLITPEAMGALRANRRVDSGKAAEELGHRPRPVRESVEDIYAWFRSRGMLER